MARFPIQSKVLAVGEVSGRALSGDDEPPATPRIDPGVGLGSHVRIVDRFASIRLARSAEVHEGEIGHLLGPPLSRLLDEGHIRQVLDLGGVDRAGASLVTCLAYHHCRVRCRDGSFRLHGVGVRLSAALGYCGLLAVLDLYDNEEDALRGGDRPTSRA